MGKVHAFFDTSLTYEERIRQLLLDLTVEEKIGLLSGKQMSIERIGLRNMMLGGEAAHGAENRNDQFAIGDPDITTSLPQPVGMACSWDRELMQKAGGIVGTEVRVVAKRHDGRGLSRWAPTVDLCRDPRWGRNEEGYGEDPYLTGEIAGAYIRGMQGDFGADKKYLRCASTLKHFYGNNTEDGRGYKNSSIDPKNKRDLYLEPFRKCIEEGGAEGVMTAYNKINGIPGAINKEDIDILKKEYGLTHVVTDGGGTTLVVAEHHFFGSHEETVTAALKAGVDSFSDGPFLMDKALRNAYAFGMIEEADIDKALRNTFMTKLRLGVFDSIKMNPYDNVTEADILSERSREICKKLTDESLVLLKNDGSFLPLGTDLKPSDIAVIGPNADIWYHDWYGGEPPYRSTLKQGIEKILGSGVETFDGYDRIVLKADGRYIGLDEKKTLCVCDEPQEFILGDWGSGSYTFQDAKTRLFVRTYRTDVKSKEEERTGLITADTEEPFDWFVNELFHIEKKEDGTVKITNRYDSELCILEDGTLAAQKVFGSPESLIRENEGRIPKFTMETVTDGLRAAKELAKGKKAVILALGCTPTINAKETVDRTTIELPGRQADITDAVTSVNENACIMLISNYPYAMKDTVGKVKAMLWSASGSQDMGYSAADALFGKVSPAGRLNMTWYLSDNDLPPIDDYDIIKGKRTYRYFDKEVMFPFGYGLTYPEMEYSGLSVTQRTDDSGFDVSFKIRNKGSMISDEAASVYIVPPFTKRGPLKRLSGFTRVHDIKPGETVDVKIYIPYDELALYDVVSRTKLVAEGDYTFFAGRSSADENLSIRLHVNGTKRPGRKCDEIVRADHYDDYENAELTAGICGFTGVRQLDPEKECVLHFEGFTLPDKADGTGKESVKELLLFVDADDFCDFDAQVYVNGKQVGKREKSLLDRLSQDQKNGKKRVLLSSDIIIPFNEPVETDENVDITLKFSGKGVRICYVKAVCNKEVFKWF